MTEWSGEHLCRAAKHHVPQHPEQCLGSGPPGQTSGQILTLPVTGCFLSSWQSPSHPESNCRVSIRRCQSSRVRVNPLYSQRCSVVSLDTYLRFTRDETLKTPACVHKNAKQSALYKLNLQPGPFSEILIYKFQGAQKRGKRLIQGVFKEIC